MPIDHSTDYSLLDSPDCLTALESSELGLDDTQITLRQQRFGKNTLPAARLKSGLTIFFQQFLNPLIYVLIVAAVISLVIGEWADAFFIVLVLIFNALIGAFQESSAQKSAAALQNLVRVNSRVLRADGLVELDASELVPGDIVQLESGDKVPADMRLLHVQDLLVDESLLTGESVAVVKQTQSLTQAQTVSERSNMVFAGTLINNGRATALVTTTGLQTEIGRIAQSLLVGQTVKPPLLMRMEKFTRRITWLMGVFILLLAAINLWQGGSWIEVMLMAAALAVAAIPEGLPVAMTVALSLSMHRMAKRHVIVKRLVTVEALGSCTYIASDKTGTLTINELTVQEVFLAGKQCYRQSERGHWQSSSGMALDNNVYQTLREFSLAVSLNNEAVFHAQGDAQTSHGDAVDIALLQMANSFGISQQTISVQYKTLALIPFESARQYSAGLFQGADSKRLLFVKGALETLLPMCSNSRRDELQAFQQQAEQWASRAYRVIAVASGEGDSWSDEGRFSGLSLIGMVAIIDPLRREAKQAIAQCHQAGITVAMLTGDHPLTALAIARELGLASELDEVVSGRELDSLTDRQAFLDKVASAHVFARVSPQQKYEIVRALQAQNQLVAVTGDGANDAPALRAAHVGVAMGAKGTDVARESAELILTDDNFSSIVAGVEEGRIAYANVRKVIFLLISTGLGELVLFTLSLLAGLPLPLGAVQLLWLNLVTNGIQDVALAFEKGEGDELHRRPRSPREAIFNRLMIERVLVSALTMGVVAFAVFSYLLSTGMSLVQAQSMTLLLMVLFENVHVFNARSERNSVFTTNPFANRFLFLATFGAQGVHIAAMYIPGLNTVLGIEPVSLQQWFMLLMAASILLFVNELYKLWLRPRHLRQD